MIDTSSGNPVKVVFLDRIAIHTTLRPLNFRHEWAEYDVTAPEDVIPRLRGATIAITNRVHFGEQQLAQLPDLKMVAVSATGYDCIDVEACRRHGVTVTNVRDWSTFAVTEHVFATALALRRQLFDYRDRVRNGDWQRSAYYGILQDPLPGSLYGATLGIIGYGAIGQRIARLGEAFGMQVLVAGRKSQSPAGDRHDFDHVLKNADILCVCCPLAPETIGLIGSEELRLMKKTALLINVSRGRIVDDGVLAAAVRDGCIGGAGTDVLESEPPRDGNPLLDLDLPNLIVTPHVAFASDQSIGALAEQLMRTVEAFVAGHPINVVSDGR